MTTCKDKAQTMPAKSPRRKRHIGQGFTPAGKPTDAKRRPIGMRPLLKELQECKAITDSGARAVMAEFRGTCRSDRPHMIAAGRLVHRIRRRLERMRTKLGEMSGSCRVPQVAAADSAVVDILDNLGRNMELFATNLRRGLQEDAHEIARLRRRRAGDGETKHAWYASDSDSDSDDDFVSASASPHYADAASAFGMPFAVPGASPAGPAVAGPPQKPYKT